MLVAGDLITKCAITLKDPDYVRWSQDELLMYLDEGQREIARNPGAYVKTVILAMVEGTKQAMPDDSNQLMTVVRNFDGEEPSDPVRITTRELLDAFEPNWHTSPKHQIVENYVYDDRNPTVFFVYPPNDGAGSVEIQYNAVPPKLTKTTDTLSLRDEFETPLRMYVLYRAYTKDSDYSSGLNLANTFFQSFVQGTTAVLESRGTNTPNTALVSGAVNGNGGTE